MPALADEPAARPVDGSRTGFFGRIWDVRTDTLWFGGEPVERDYVDHTGAVGIVALNDDDSVMLVQQYRHPVRQRLWEIPAGLLDLPGESPLVAAQRELAEEADLVAEEWHVLLDLLPSPGGSNESIRLYLARGLSPAVDEFDRVDEEAEFQHRWVPLDDAVAAVLAGRVQNAATVAGLLATHAARAAGWSTLRPADAPWPTRSAGPRATGDLD
ncbi:MAG TPA: NUDIX hydrolase [Candidatus Lumbricidophila sp.]|nr:NUDIX hydrolase [Candidatus Lumbricidophila sp.]